jgi:hypothetical protein
MRSYKICNLSPVEDKMVKVSIAQVGERRNAYRLLLGKPEGRRQLIRPRHR